MWIKIPFYARISITQNTKFIWKCLVNIVSIEVYLIMVALPKYVIGWMEIKFHPEVKKSMSKFHCPVLSRSDGDHKDCFCTQYKARSPETVPTNFWQLKSVHSLAIREKHRPWSPETTSQDKQKIVTSSTKEWISSTFFTLFNFA